MQPVTPPVQPVTPPVEPDEPADHEVEPAEHPAPRRKRDWGSILQKTFDKINKSFSAAEDEEI